MKKRLLSLLLTGALVASLAGCGNTSGSGASSSSNQAEDKTITVGACVTPHAEILNGVVKGLLEEKGYELKVVEYNDYVQPNKALDSGELDANYFQHQPYLDEFNQENGTDIVAVAKVHFEPLAIYGGKTTSLDDLKDGASVAVPNDTTNEARALLLLQEQGLITLKDDAGLNATVVDITDNPHNLKINEIEAAQITRSIQDVDIACINGNYAIEGGLNAADALAIESEDSDAAQTYANIVAVNSGDENTDKTKALVEAINSDEVRDYINDNYSGSVKPVF